MKWYSRKARVAFCALLGLVLAACHTEPPKPPPAPEPPPLVPGKGIGIYKIGQPYQVNGIWYYPSSDLTYDETGIATWYGPDYKQSFTANGEIYDPNELTAAHQTLPMPSIVQVTNLDNGRSIELRINDRGPFTPGRIIDLSPRAALYLDMQRQGTARVHIRVLLAPTLQAQSLAKMNGNDAAAPVDAAPPAVPREALVSEALPPPVTSAGGKKTLPPPVPGIAPAVRPNSAAPSQQGPTPPGPKLPDTVYQTMVYPTRLYVQAGSFSTTVPANRLKARLGSIGAVVISVVRINGADQFRVRIGPLADVPSADAVLSKVLTSGLPDARIVVD